MKKTVIIFIIALVLCTTLIWSCGGGGGGVDDAITDTSFTIGYNANGAESGSAPAAQSGNGKEVLSVSANTGSLAKDGYLFDGWNTSADGSGADYAPGALHNGKNLTLYAKWARLFDYNPNVMSPAPALNGVQNVSGVSTATITGLTPRGMTLSDITIPRSIDGYQVVAIGNYAFQGCTNVTNMLIPDTVSDIGDNAFNGCSNLSNLTMQRTEPPALGTDVFAGCVLLAVSVPQSAVSEYNAQWSTVTILSPGTFSIIYNGNGADGGIVPSRQVGMTGITIFVYGNNGSLTRAGCTFNGWNDKADGTGHSYAENAAYPGPDNMTLYAQWTHPDYIVTFDGDGANTQASPASIAVKAPANTIEELPSTPPKKDGFYFGGWYTQRNGAGDQFVVGSKVISDKIVYAYWTLRPDFTVTYNDQGATTPPGHSSKIVVAPKTTVEELPTPPINTGYIFGGWYTGQNGTGTQFTADTPVDDNITVYAKWNTYSYTVTFDSQGADTAAYPESKEVRSPATTVESLPSDPVKDGCVFDGWYTGTNGNGDLFTASTIVTQNMRVYANWSTLYSVTYDGNGNTGGQAPDRQRGENGDNIILQGKGNLERTGYTFSGWNTSTDGTGVNYSAGDNHVMNGNLILYAKWIPNTYQITYKDKGGSAFSGVHGNNYPTTHTYGNNTLLIGPTKEGYVFGGWYTDSACTGSVLDIIAADAFTGNITLYAKWNTYSFTVTFDSQGADTAAYPESKAVRSPATTVESLPSDPVKDGCVFDGWYTETNGGGVLFTASTVVTQNMRVYANWLTLYSVTYDGNGNTGGQAPDRQRGENGDTITLQGKGNLERTGYTFSGWNTSTDGTGINYSAGDNHVMNGNLILYAKWTANVYQITYKDKGGSAFSGVHGNNYPTSHTYGTDTVLINPKKAWATFGGWYTDSACTGSVLDIIAADAFTGNITLYAKWEPYRYTVTFDSQFATTPPSETTRTVSSPNTTVSSLPERDPIKTGFIFDGWYTQPGGQGELFTVNTVVEDDITVYAKWIALFKYSTSNEKVTITGLTNEGKELTSIVIPSSIDGNPVTSIGYAAFENNRNLINVTLPDSIISIGRSAFHGCTEITDFNIPNSVVSIGYNGNVAYGAFEGCTGLTSITIPNSVTNLGWYTFKGCTNLTNIVIGNKVNSLGDYIFDGCKNLTSIEIPNSVTSIGNNAFFSCIALTSVTIGNGVTAIGNSAFYGCTGLTSITIPDGVTSIESHTFNGCLSLSNITIPDSVTTIGFCAFSGCKGLTSLTFGNGLTTVRERAFESCSSLTRVNISDLAAWCKIDFEARSDYNCSASYPSSPGHSHKLYLNGSEITNLVIPEGVTTLKGSFYGCNNITSVIFPKSMTSIGHDAFRGCEGLTSITIPDNITSIGHRAFYNCSNLSSITIPDSVTSIGSCFINGCYGLSSITIPSSVKYLYERAVDASLPLLIIQGITPPKKSGYTYEEFFDPYFINTIIKVPAEAVEIYKAADVWKKYANNIVADE